MPQSGDSTRLSQTGALITFEPPHKQGHLHSVLSLAFSPSNPTLLASASQDATVRLWDVLSGPTHPFVRDKTDQTHHFVRNTGHDRSCPGSQRSCPACTALLASASQDATVRLWDVLSGRVPYTRVSCPVSRTEMVCRTSLAVCRSLLASASQDASVRLWDVLSGRVPYSVQN